MKIITMKALALHNFYGGIEIFAIKSGDSFFHLSFSRNRHDKAINFLQKLGYEIDTGGPLESAALIEYLSANHPTNDPVSFDSPFIRRGTPFQKKVWRLISRIPSGETRTYGQLARQLGNVRLSRAIGQACGANPLALIIPCHRVIGTGTLGGFAGGLDIKRRLLDMEQLPKAASRD